MRPLALFLALSAAPAASPQALQGPRSSAEGTAAREQSVDLLLLGNVGPTVDLGVAALLEGAMGEAPERFRYRQADFVTVLFDGRTSLPGWPNGAPAPGEAGCEGAETPALEVPTGFLALEPGADPALLEAMERLAEGGELPSFSGGYERLRPVRRTVVVGRLPGPGGAELDCLRFADGPERSPPYWDKTLAAVYELDVGSRTVRAWAVGYAYGGLHRAVEALRRFKTERPEGIAVSRGDTLRTFESWKLPQYGLLEGYLDAGLDLIVPGREELEDWTPLRSYWNDRAPSASFLAANAVPGPQGPELVPSVLRQAGPVRVALFGLVQPELAAHLHPSELLRIEEPVQAARRAVERLRRKADLLVGVGNLLNEGLADLDHRVHGLDLLLGSVARSSAETARRTVEVGGREREPHPQALLAPPLQEAGAARVRATFDVGGSAPSLVRLESWPVSLGPYAPASSTTVRYASAPFELLTGSREALIPDPRRLWPQRRRFFLEDREFWTLSAGLLRRQLGAEAAVLKVHKQSANRVGELTAGVVDFWLDVPDRVVLARVPGRRLRSLAARARDQAEREAIGLRDPTEVRVTVSGVSPDGKVQGLPLNDDELYRVALSDYFLGHPDLFPELAQAARRERFERGDGPPRPDDDGDPLPVAELVRAALRELRRDDPSGELLKRLVEGAAEPPPAVWKLRFNRVGVNFSSTRTGNAAAFQQVRNSRVTAQDQLLLGGEADLRSELYLDRLRWDLGAVLALSRLRLDVPGLGTVTNEPRDQVRLETGLGYGFAWEGMPALGRFWGPYLDYAYDTEFTPVEGLNRKSLHQGGLGVRLSQGDPVRSLKLGFVAQRDQAKAQPANQYGVNASAQLGLPFAFPGQTLDSELTAKYLFPSALDTAEDLQLELGLKARLGMTLWKDLRLSPFVDLFLFRSRILDRTGTSLLVGVEAGFSRLWKPLSEPLWE